MPEFQFSMQLTQLGLKRHAPARALTIPSAGSPRGMLHRPHFFMTNRNCKQTFLTSTRTQAKINIHLRRPVASNSPHFQLAALETSHRPQRPPSVDRMWPSYMRCLGATPNANEVCLLRVGVVWGGLGWFGGCLHFFNKPGQKKKYVQL